MLLAIEASSLIASRHVSLQEQVHKGGETKPFGSYQLRCRAPELPFRVGDLRGSTVSQRIRRQQTETRALTIWTYGEQSTANTVAAVVMRPGSRAPRFHDQSQQDLEIVYFIIWLL